MSAGHVDLATMIVAYTECNCCRVVATTESKRLCQTEGDVEVSRGGPPALSVPNSPYGVCSFSELMSCVSCVKVEVAVLDRPK